MPKRSGQDKRTTKMRLIETQYDQPIEELLTQLYDEYGNVAGVAQHLSEQPTTVWRWMRRLGIPMSTGSKRAS